MSSSKPTVLSVLFVMTITMNFVSLPALGDATKAEHRLENEWKLLLSHVPFTGTEYETVAFQTHDNTLKIDYVIIKNGSGDILLEDVHILFDD